MRRRLRVLLPLLPLVLLVAADQVVNVTALSDGVFLGAAVAPFDPPLFNAEQREALERIRRGEVRGGVRFDAELGWEPDPTTGAYGPLGERRAAVDEDPKEAKRLAVFGGSFTHGDEVLAHEAWPAVIDRRRADWEVLNLGVGAYGADQAFLRWRRVKDSLDADEVWIGVMPAAVPRLSTVYRPALRHHDRSVSFKPRFVLRGDGALELLDNPARTLADVARLVDDQAAFFEVTYGKDAWVTRWPAAYRPAGTHASHRSAVARLVLTRLEQGTARVADADSLALLHALLETMRREVLASGARFRAVLLPHRSLPHEEAWWSKARFASFPLEVPAVAALAGAGDADLFRPGGHYSPRGNEVVAEALLPLLDG